MPEPTSKELIRNEVFPVKTVKSRPVAAPVSPHSGLTQNDILYALFRHKWKILVFFIAGLVAAIAAYVLYPPIYESQAKLLVRYLVERSSVDGADGGSGVVSRTEGTVLGSEVEILSSWDLAVQVAEAVGPKRLLPHSQVTPTKEAAAATIASGIKVLARNNIIFVSYRNREPELATLVLNELVNRYFNKHLEVHRSAGAFDFVTQQTDQVKARLNQTEDALKDIKEKAGVVSFTSATTALSSEAVRLEEELHSAEADVAEQGALVQQLGLGSEPALKATKRALPVDAKVGDSKAGSQNSNSENNDSSASSGEEPSAETTQQYQILVSRLPQLRQENFDLLGKYTPENQMVKVKQAEIAQVEAQRRALEKRYPELSTRVAPLGSSKAGQLDPATAVARLAGLKAKKEAMAARLHEVQDRIKQLSQLEPQVADLERQKQLQETNYKYFQGTLEKARVDEALDPSKIPNISAVQRATPPALVTAQRDKLVLMLAGGGLAAGIAFALLKELVLNRTISRPVEIEKFIGVSPMLSIPYSPQGNSTSSFGKNGKSGALVPAAGSKKNLAPWDANHFIRRYCEAMRDRIGLYFELNRLTHKPKLVGVAGFSSEAGTSTIAAGLAAALSETGDGKVLLVDVNLGPQDVHPFFQGRPAYALTTALQRADALHSASDNLYLAAVSPPNAGPAQLGLKKFFDLMPNLRASDFDYIIFDMPPLAQTSPTLSMAGFMDKLLLVVEAGKDDRETTRRGYSNLVAIRDNVSLVINKVRSSTPKWIDGDF